MERYYSSEALALFEEVDARRAERAARRARHERAAEVLDVVGGALCCALGLATLYLACLWAFL